VSVIDQGKMTGALPGKVLRGPGYRPQEGPPTAVEQPPAMMPGRPSTGVDRALPLGQANLLPSDRRRVNPGGQGEP
jgi:hypothetical protein